MGRPELIFASAYPPELMEPVREVVRRYAPYLPLRLREVHVRFANDDADDGSDTGRAGTVIPSEEYGFSAITLFPNWATSTPLEREQVLVHELVAHCILEPLVHFTVDLTGHFVPEGPSREFIQERWRLSYEATTDELTAALLHQQRALERLS